MEQAKKEAQVLTSFPRLRFMQLYARLFSKGIFTSADVKCLQRPFLNIDSQIGLKIFCLQQEAKLAAARAREEASAAAVEKGGFA